MGIDFKMALLLKLTTIDSGNRLEEEHVIPWQFDN